MRLFVAVDLPDWLADAVAAVQEPLDDADGLRFTDPGQAHLTLKFFGAVEEGRREAVEAVLEGAVDDAGVDAFDCEVGGLGVFPDIDYISVVWAGVRTGAPELTRLHEAIERRSRKSGFDPVENPFTPHVTLARMDDARGKGIVQRAVRETDPTVGRFEADAVRLKRSTLTDDGPEYETLREVKL